MQLGHNSLKKEKINIKDYVLSISLSSNIQYQLGYN